MVKMHQTTVRFGAALWEELDREARVAGVSAAQYVREAVVARLAFTAGQRGDPAFLAALGAAGVSVEPGSDSGGDEVAVMRERMHPDPGDPRGNVGMRDRMHPDSDDPKSNAGVTRARRDDEGQDTG
jgi:hypothetical protein